MSSPQAPYPPDLMPSRVILRAYVFNLVMASAGALLMGNVSLSPTQESQAGPLYYFIWGLCAVQCGMCNLLLVLWIARRGWRRQPDAQARYVTEGLLMALPLTTRWQILLVSALNIGLASWGTHLAFIAIQDSAWGQAILPQTRQPYLATLSMQAYGMLMSVLFEYICERYTLQKNRLQAAERLGAQAQLDLLRSQLDPHLLFNTLSNLYELIDEQPERARSMLLHLIGFLRSTLIGSRQTEYPLQQEFKVISDYLSLMQIRMGERLRTTLTLPEELRQTMVPALLLQPLVENAIQHGLERRKDGGELSVIARQEGAEVVLEVSNTGGGPQPTLPPADEDRLGGGFGLHCVRERLAALYGIKASFDLQHLMPEQLTRVTIRLPLSPHHRSPTAMPALSSTSAPTSSPA